MRKLGKMNREQYAAELARILRELLPAGAKRDYGRMIELAKDLEELAMAARGGKFNEDEG